VTVGVFGKRTSTLFDLLKYTPTAGQIPILCAPEREILVAGGFQSGKSHTAAKMLLKRFPEDLERASTLVTAGRIRWPMTYWLVGNDYAATTKEFEYLRDDLAALHLLGKCSKRVDPGVIPILGQKDSADPIAIIRTISSADVRNIRMEAPFGIVCCEASELTLEAFQRIRERVVPLGAWLFLSGTFEEDAWGWYAQLHREWSNGIGGRRSFSLATDSNTALFPAGENDPYIKRFREENSYESYQQRIKGIPCAPRGIVFPEFRETLHVGPVSYDSSLPVKLWCDPGYGSDSAHAILAVQIERDQVRIIDEIYVQRMTTEEIIDDILTFKEWWRNVDCLVDDKYYSSQHHAQTSVEEIWLRKTGLVNRGEREPLKPRLERIHSFLKPMTDSGQPKLIIAPHCAGILSEFGCRANPFTHTFSSYRWRIGDDGQPQGSNPIDRFNHAIEALGRGLVFEFGYVGAVKARKKGGFVSFRGTSSGGKKSKKHYVGTEVL